MKGMTTEERDRLLKIAGKHYAATYLLMSIAIDHAEEGDIAVSKLGMNKNEIKKNAHLVMKHFDIFCQDFKKYIAKGDSSVILRDFEQLKPEIDKILDLKL